MNDTMDWDQYAYDLDQWFHKLHQRFLRLRPLPVREEILSLYLLEEALTSGAMILDTVVTELTSDLKALETAVKPDECNGIAECNYYGGEDTANEKLMDSVVESATNQKAYEAPSYLKKKDKTKNEKKKKKKQKASIELEWDCYRGEDTLMEVIDSVMETATNYGGLLES